MKNISILGSTGSIGLNTLSVIDTQPQQFKVKGLAAGKNIELLEQQIKKYKPEIVAVADETKAKILKKRLKKLKCEILSGEQGLKEVATLSKVDLVVLALSGSVGLIPTLAAIKKGKNIALANKELLVMAGEIIMEEVKKKNTILFPIDSEHSAIFQCLKKEDKNKVKRIILTASGGPFLNYSLKKLKKVSLQKTLIHPIWPMGKKITIDSATLLNKSLEVIECHHLFDIDFDKIEVLIHPESIIHSMVEFIDHSVLAQMSVPDMRLPIQYALNFGERQISLIKPLDLVKIKTLNFNKPSLKKFPCLALGYQAGKIGGTMPAVLNAAGEVAVNLFLQRKIDFLEICSLIKKIMASHKVLKNPSLKEILSAALKAKEEVKKIKK